MLLWDQWKKGFDAWESATAKCVEEWMKSPLVLGPSGAHAHRGDEGRRRADDAKAHAGGAQMGLPTKRDQERVAAPAQPAPEPHHGPRGEARRATRT